MARELVQVELEHNITLQTVEDEQLCAKFRVLNTFTQKKVEKASKNE